MTLLSKILDGSIRDDPLWQAVVENRRVLDSCPGPHVFEPVPDELTARTPTLWRKERCATCGGTVHRSEAAWYKLGLSHQRQVSHG